MFMYTYKKTHYYRHLVKLIFLLLVVLVSGYILSGCYDGPDAGGEPNSAKAEQEITITLDEEVPLARPEETNDRQNTTNGQVESITPGTSENTDSGTSSVTANTAPENKLKVTFLDVGQADCILITTGPYNMLIDAGNNADADLVVNYIKNQGISKLDYVIGTHPHEDHIGGLDAVINSFEIGKILMPKQSSTTKTFEDVLTAIRSKGLKVTSPKVGDTYTLGEAKWTILGPGKTGYDNANNASIVIRLTHGNCSFLFVGDAENEEEQEILNLNVDIKSDLLKVGHHGSKTSTSAEFLKAVSPRYAVISVGAGNDYGHPHAETLAKLNEAGVQIYRTDEDGTIIVTSDGKSIIFDKKASPVKENAPPASDKTNNKVANKNNGASGTQAESSDQVKQSKKDNKQGYQEKQDKQEKQSKQAEAATQKAESKSGSVTVYITKTGEKYHRDGCSYLSKSKIAINLDNAIASGYTPCSRCNPPR